MNQVFWAGTAILAVIAVLVLIRVYLYRKYPPKPDHFNLRVRLATEISNRLDVVCKGTGLERVVLPNWDLIHRARHVQYNDDLLWEGWAVCRGSSVVSFWDLPVEDLLRLVGIVGDWVVLKTGVHRAQEAARSAAWRQEEEIRSMQAALATLAERKEQA